MFIYVEFRPHFNNFFQLSYGNCLLVIYFLILGEAHFMCGGGSQFCLSDM